MHRVPRHLRRSIATIAALTLFTACGDIETTPPQDPALTLPEGNGRERAEQGLTPELYGVGASWYDYDPATHTLTPEPAVYVVRAGERITLIEVISYYDDQGESGVFTLRALSHDGAAWATEPVQRQLSKNVKDETVCVDAATLEERACADATLAMRAALRPLPAAGFAVREPAIYALHHYSQQDAAPISVAAVEAATLEDAPRDVAQLAALDPLPSSSATPEDSLVGWLRPEPDAPVREESYLQITANMIAAQWRVLDVTEADDAITVSVGVRCQALNMANQKPFPDEETVAEVRLERTSDYDVALVQVCDADAAPATRVHTSSSAPFTGVWPDTDQFDIIVEHVQGRVAIRVAPANLVWNYTLANPDEAPDAIIPLADVFAEEG